MYEGLCLETSATRNSAVQRFKLEVKRSGQQVSILSAKQGLRQNGNKVNMIALGKEEGLLERNDET